MYMMMDFVFQMLLYTSLDIDTFQILVDFLSRFTINYIAGWRVTSLSSADQLLMTLMKLRLNLRDLDLADRFNISRTTVSNVTRTYIHVLHETLVVGIMHHAMPSQSKCRGSMPKSFKEFTSARMIIDCTETTQDIPQALDKQRVSYSNYKSRHTVKALTCVAPNAAITFCSDLYPGSTSDVAIVEHCKILDQVKPGDLLLADKGFRIHDKLPAGASLNIPPFLSNKTTFTRAEAQMCQKIARARVHVERANERIKNYEILRHISHTYRPLISKIFKVCCVLVNFQAPLLKDLHSFE